MTKIKISPYTLSCHSGLRLRGSDSRRSHEALRELSACLPAGRESHTYGRSPEGMTCFIEVNPGSRIALGQSTSLVRDDKVFKVLDNILDIGIAL